MKAIISTFSIFLVSITLYGQDSLLLVDGTVRRGKIEKITKTRIEFTEDFVFEEINSGIVASVYRDGRIIDHKPEYRFEPIVGLRDIDKIKQVDVESVETLAFGLDRKNGIFHSLPSMVKEKVALRGFSVYAIGPNKDKYNRVPIFGFRVPTITEDVMLDKLKEGKWKLVEKHKDNGQIQTIGSTLDFSDNGTFYIDGSKGGEYSLSEKYLSEWNTYAITLTFLKAPSWDKLAKSNDFFVGAVEGNTVMLYQGFYAIILEKQ